MHDSERIIGLYERHASAYDRDRGRSLFEKLWLDRFINLLTPGATVLDLGCGMGEPIASYLLRCGLNVVGIDSSASMIKLCQVRFPGSEWIIADMRRLDLGRRFDGLVAWDSFFHLTAADQRAMFRCFAAHAKPAAPLLFTSGPGAGEAIGSFCDEPLYHASLDSAEYIGLLDAHGFGVEAHQAEDAECGGHTVWLSRFSDSTAM
jgi:SAM-dependent methyltransferase